MTRKEIEEIVTEIANPVVNKHSFELVDVEFIKEGSSWYLRIYIDKPADNYRRLPGCKRGNK